MLCVNHKKLSPRPFVDQAKVFFAALRAPSWIKKRCSSCPFVALRGQKEVKVFLLPLRANRKSLTGAVHPDRNRQFGYIRRVRQQFLRAGYPVISVDTKNKELVGNFANQGRCWRQTPEQVNRGAMRWVGPYPMASK